MEPITTGYLYQIISKCTQGELQQISLPKVKGAYSSLGLKPGNKRKDELINEVVGFLASILIRQYNGSQLREGFPLFNLNNELFQRDIHIRNLIEACNQQIHIANIQLAQLNFNTVNQVARTLKPPGPVYRCYCNQTIDPNFITDPVIKCINAKCGKVLHKYCMKLKTEKEDYPLFECPECVLSKCDPLHEVVRVLIPPYVVDSQRRDFMIDESVYKEIKNHESIGIEVRSIRLEDKSHEQTWPHSGELILNQYKYLEFKPLQQNSSLKKRKDEKFFSREVKCGINHFWLKYTPRSDPRNPRADETYIAAVYLIRKLSPEELIKKLISENKRSLEECKIRIKQDFESSTIDIDKLVYPLTCVLDMQLLKTPAKGAHCKHSNVFSLENFVAVWQKNNQRKWNCPICKLKSYDIIIDTFWEKILLEAKKMNITNPMLYDVEILKNGEFNFVKNDDESDSDEEAKIETKKEEKKENINVIVLDDSDEDEPKEPKEKTPPTVNTVNKKADTPVQKDNEVVMDIEKEIDQTVSNENTNVLPAEKKDENKKEDKVDKPVAEVVISESDEKSQRILDTIPDIGSNKGKTHQEKEKEKEKEKQKEKEKEKENIMTIEKPSVTVEPVVNKKPEPTLENIPNLSKPNTMTIEEPKPQPFVQPDLAKLLQTAALPSQIQPEKPTLPAFNLGTNPLAALQNTAGLANLFNAFTGNPTIFQQPTNPLSAFLTPALKAKMQQLQLAERAGLGVGDLSAFLFPESPYKQLGLGADFTNPLYPLLNPMHSPFDLFQTPGTHELAMLLNNANRLQQQQLAFQQQATTAANLLTKSSPPQTNIKPQTIPQENVAIHANNVPHNKEIENTNSLASNTTGLPKTFIIEKEKPTKRILSEAEKSIEKLTGYSENKLELPSFDNYKSKKYMEMKKFKENEFQKNKKLVTLVMKQIPLQSKAPIKIPKANENTGMAIEKQNSMLKDYGSDHSLENGNMKARGKESDPICLD